MVTCLCVMKLMVKENRDGTRALLFLEEVDEVGTLGLMVLCRQDHGRFIDFLLQ